jgi:hypothetical protein
LLFKKKKIINKKNKFAFQISVFMLIHFVVIHFVEKKTYVDLPPPQAIQPVMSMPVRRLKFEI